MPKYKMEFFGRRLGSGRQDCRRSEIVEASGLSDAWQELRKTFDVTTKGKATEVLEVKRMTPTEFNELQAGLLKKVPQEFKSPLSYMAWEHGHSSGYEEVLSYLREYINDLLPAIEEYGRRMKGS